MSSDNNKSVKDKAAHFKNTVDEYRQRESHDLREGDSKEITEVHHLYNILDNQNAKYSDWKEESMCKTAIEYHIAKLKKDHGYNDETIGTKLNDVIQLEKKEKIRQEFLQDLNKENTTEIQRER